MSSYFSSTYNIYQFIKESHLQLIRRVFIVSEVLRDLVEGVEVEHPLHDDGGPQHPHLRPPHPLLLRDDRDHCLKTREDVCRRMKPFRKKDKQLQKQNNLILEVSVETKNFLFYQGFLLQTLEQVYRTRQHFVCSAKTDTAV